MRIHHLAMRTLKLARLESFYAETLGLPVIQRDGARSVWLRAGDAILMIEQAEASEPPIPAMGMDLVAFAVHVDDVERYRRILIENQIETESETAYTIYFRDPDGRRIGISHFPGEKVTIDP